MLDNQWLLVHLLNEIIMETMETLTTDVTVP